MRLTKQRKIFAAFLGLAAVAFLADRLFFLPAGAGAAPIVEAEPEADKPGPVETAAPAPKGPSLAARLSTVGRTVNESSERDPFSRVWLARGNEKAPVASDLPASPSAFEAAHELTAVLDPRTGKGMAVIGRKGAAQGTEAQSTVRIGGMVDGWTLVSIDATSVSFKCGASRVTLELKGKVDNQTLPGR